MSEKFTSRRKSAILRKMREGHYAKTAAETSGITEQTLYNWLKKGGDPTQCPERAAFLEAYRKAEATAEGTAIKAIQDAFPTDWRAVMTYLERRHPDRWARRQNVDVTQRRADPHHRGGAHRAGWRSLKFRSHPWLEPPLDARGCVLRGAALRMRGPVLAAILRARGGPRRRGRGRHR